jgi:uncharacterized protein YukE
MENLGGGGSLEITPTEVFHVATLGRVRHEELAGTYASTQSQGWDAEPRWVGRSGAALSGLLDRWQSDATEHHRLLNQHHDGLCAAATVLPEIDDRNSQLLNSVTQQ